MARFILKEGIAQERLGEFLFELGREFKRSASEVQKAFVQNQEPSEDIERHEDYERVNTALANVLDVIDPVSSKINETSLEVRFVFDHLQEKQEDNGSATRVVYVAVPDFTDYEDGNKLIGDEKLTGVAREAMGFVSIMGCTN